MADINDILGNERVKEHFIAAVHHKKISHAYIIEGDKGSGKKMLAAAFSKILQCETRQKTEEERACNQCESCIQMENKDHPDVIWVSHEKAGVISVGEIREQVVNTVDIMPYKGPYKIYIIDEAEKMNVAAQNAILKTIEEPPEYAIIFLLTTNRGAFLDTLDILRYIHEIESYEIADKVKEYKKYKARIDDFFDIFLMWFRDILLLKADTSPDKDIARRKIIFKNEYISLRKQADKLKMDSIDYIINRINRARIRIKSNVNFDAALELLIVEARREF